MADTVYYCEILDDYHCAWEFPKGVIAIPFRSEHATKINRCVSYSHRVWKQGPRGGVKILKDKLGDEYYGYGYVTKNEKAMKEFMWVKLQAQMLANYT